MAPTSEPVAKTRSLPGWKVVVPVALVAAAAGVAALVLSQTSHGTQWRTHEEASFTVETPTDWSVSELAGKVTIDGGSAERVVIWPFFVPTQLAESGAEFIARNLASKVVPDATWGSRARPGPGSSASPVTRPKTRWSQRSSTPRAKPVRPAAYT